ncbi:cbb3-type cytochrome c oxidase subunit I [Melaminivora alkalimesophila]|uniref:Cytochrome c oxidase cbb3-type subunit 1 n=1 Tax=Melaminivora alkalimesophila TaxID=1165852 RepID=A0A317RAI8_9BURK|nr:cbb3-type cytochrome c oxidase subunit I [Melaminivora alkalimesophila]PWW46017.1 cytochrome c oxidase cbb3-type subunit 1 [Melaminivora alkalimesophila]
MDSAVMSLLGAFLLSIIGLFVFIWSMRKGLLMENPRAASVIFAPGEIGHVDDPALKPAGRAELQAAAVEPGDTAHVPDAQALAERIEADRSSAFPVFMFIAFACLWLVLGSVAGLTASLKLHMPDWLVSEAWMTFGRIRTVHLTAVLYGWITNASLGVIIWLLPRLLRTPLMGAMWVMLGGALINVAIASGIGAIGAGWTDGMEYLEMPWQIGLFIVAGMVCIIGPVLYTLVNRKVESLYVTVWYHVAALLWITLLFLVAKLPGVHYGVQQATMNWWYGHNVLGLWFTPVSVGAIYYFLPKIIARPVRSYNLSILGFWTLAFFYAQVGGHHLVGGPVPGWLVTLSIVQSMMMIIPVAAFSINMAGTMWGRTRLALHSPTLRFMMFGGLMYMLSSVQGSFEALRSVNQVAHFTHFTVAHAHLGAYGFVTMVLFGAIYFMMPRVLHWEWPYPRLISLQFWLAAIGILIYFVGLSIGGWLQGLAMLDASRPFMDSVALTIPYLQSRSVGGALMVASQVIFVGHFLAMALRFGPARTGAALFRDGAHTMELAHGK